MSLFSSFERCLCREFRRTETSTCAPGEQGESYRYTFNGPNAKRSNCVRVSRVVDGAFKQRKKGRPGRQLRLQPELN